MKQPTCYSILPFLFFLLFSLYWAASYDHTEKFVQCLGQFSINSTTLSEIIYTTNNPFYAKILNMFIRNLLYQTPDTPKPVAVLTPTQESHVQAAIYCSKNAGLQMRIRSGGNDIEGSSYVSYVPFFVLDTYGFRSISVDPTTETAWVGAGATLGELYYAINQTDSTLAFPGGFWPTVGVGGHICSSGNGGLIRSYGVSADNVVDARIIDASGTILEGKSMGEDLFWAIQGGSCASFGVVIAFKVKLARIPPVVAAFFVTRTLEQDAESLIYKWQYIAPNVPRELTILLEVANTLQTNSTQQTVSANFIASFLGNIDGLISLMDLHFPELGLTHKDCTTMGWPEFNMYRFAFPVENTAQLLLGRTPPFPIPFLKMKANFVKRPFPKKGLKEMLDLLMQVPVGESLMEWTPLKGKMDEIPKASIPFPHRKGHSFLVATRVSWSDTDPAITKERLAWIRNMDKIWGSYMASNPRSVFVNYRDHDWGTNNINGFTSVEQARSWGVPYYKGNFDRLVRVKTMVDPENYFYYEQSIPISL